MSMEHMQPLQTTRQPGTLQQLPAPRPDRVSLECPGCHREISGPRREERGVTCPHCNLGIPPDLVPEPPSPAPELNDLLDIALAAAQADLGPLEILQPQPR